MRTASDKHQDSHQDDKKNVLGDLNWIALNVVSLISANQPVALTFG